MARKPRPQWRISDAERFEAAGRLRAAAEEGRISRTELDERIEALYAAKIHADLRPLVRDVPRRRKPRVPIRPEPGEAVVPETIQRHVRSNALVGSESRKGVWEVAPQHHVSAYLGSVTLDLREAQFAAAETTIHVHAFLGSVDIFVNQWTRVEIGGNGVAGRFGENKPRVRPTVGPDSPLVRVRGTAVLGSVEVRRRRMPGELRRKFLGM